MILSLYMLGYKKRLPVALVLAVITLVAMLGINRLQVDTSLDSLIPSDDPARLVYQRIMNTFGTDNKTIIYVKDDQLWTPEKLAQLEQLHTRLQTIEKVTRVESLFSLHTVQGVDEKIVSKPLLREAPATQLEANAARQSALSNSLYQGHYFSEDGSVTAITVSMAEDEERSGSNAENATQALGQKTHLAFEDALSEFKTHFETLTQVGPPRINAELKQSLYEDFVLLGPLSALILVISILVFMRSWLSAFIPIVTSVLTIIWTFGLLGWLGIPINILSAMIPSLIIVIGSTEDTHLMAAYLRGLDAEEECSTSQTDGQQTPVREQAMKYMAKHVGLPLILTVVTTTLGFASNLFSNIDLIQHFSVAATLAMLINGIITIFSMPLMLSLFGKSQNDTPVKNVETNSVPDRIMRLFRYPQSHFPMLTLLFTAVLCGFFIYQATRLYVTNDPLSYFPKERPLVQDTQRIHRDLAGVRFFFIALESKDMNAFLHPKNIEKLHNTQAFLDKQGVYDLSVSIADHLKFINREFHGGAQGQHILPVSSNLVAQYLLFFHRGDLKSYVSHDYRSANIVVRHNISDSHTLNKYVNELNEALTEITGSDIKHYIVGENLMVNQAAESLMLAQIKALSLLLLLIFIIMSVMFTSFKGGFIALVPAIIPIALMFGLMGLLDIPLKPGTAMVAVIAIGIAVDGTIHLLARYNELCRYTSDFVGAVNKAVREEATPLIISSIALALGFGILLFSNFTIIAQFGALAAATMLFSVFANLLITPIIMTRIRLVGLYQIYAIPVNSKVLKSSPLFHNMNSYQRRKAVLISEFHNFKQGDLLIEQGNIGQDMYVILSGQAEVIRVDDGQQHKLANLLPGETFGEIGYVRHTERTANVVATEDLQVLRFNYKRMQQDLKFFPNIVAKLNFNISYILGARMAELVEKSRR